MLTCLAAKTEQFPKDVFLLHPGDAVKEIGMVLSGCALVVQEDIWGNRNILSRTAPGQTYAAAFACAPNSVSNVSVVTETPTTVLFLNVKRLLTVCPSAEAQRRGAVEFDIPFSRQQLADFLAVERSGLSLELGKMKKEGLLDFHKEHFVLNI